MSPNYSTGESKTQRKIDHPSMNYRLIIFRKISAHANFPIFLTISNTKYVNLEMIDTKIIKI